MKLEYIAEGSSDAPLIRLFDFSATEAVSLHDLIAGLASGAFDEVELHEMPWISPVAGCRLSLIARVSDDGIAFDRESSTFRCGLTRGHWDNVAGLVAPFCRESPWGYQWLVATTGEVALLLSPTGEW